VDVIKDYEAKRVRVFHEGELLRDYARAFLGRTKITSETPEEFQNEERKLARLYAFRLLAKRAYLKRALLEKLTGVGVEEGCAERVVLALDEEGYLSDKELIHSWVRLWTARGYSKQKITQKLREKRIPPTEIQSAVAEIDEEAELEQLRNLLEKKYGSFDLEDPAEREKVVSRLFRRGFPLHLIFRALAVFTNT